MDIQVINRFNVQKREISIYHHQNHSARVVGPGGSGDFSLQTATVGDYLFLSLVKGPGDLWKEGWILVPQCIDFDFMSSGKFRVQRRGNRNLLKLVIPAGLHEWELKLTLPGKNYADSSSDKEKTVICGDGPEPKTLL